MGYIYKIENKLNEKKYIGQTIKPLEKRFSQHKHNYTKSYFSQLALYQAFQKYGIDNFSFEQIEEVPNEKLDEREKYWISYYNSYYDGYNSTLGGRATPLYEWDIDDIIEKYQELKSARKVAEIIGCDHSTIDRILNEAGVKRYTQGQQKSPDNIVLENSNETKIFPSGKDAALWLIANGYSKSNNPRNVRVYVNEYAQGKKIGTYLGFKIYYESKRQSTPQATED